MFMWKTVTYYNNVLDVISRKFNLKHKEQGAKSSRCLPDTISNSSKTIKKGRRITSLQHVDYKKFLQCYVHVQELKRKTLKLCMHAL